MPIPVIFEIIKVDCYSGSRGDEYPKAFNTSEERIEIREILDRWYEGGVKSSHPTYNYFKVKTEEDKLFLLRHNTMRGTWSVRALNS